ncbi:hypothetical protein HDU81_004287 [Chytriomyces hyalinus]|nr:hypothetical protein HDU81_004287 [Chytriomyces hyalinus]
MSRWCTTNPLLTRFTNAVSPLAWPQKQFGLGPRAIALTRTVFAPVTGRLLERRAVPLQPFPTIKPSLHPAPSASPYVPRSRWASTVQSWRNYGRRSSSEPDPSVVIYSIIGLNTVVFLLWQYAINERKNGDPRWAKFMHDNFYSNWSSLEAGRWWTTLTSMFSHNTVLHFGLNMLVFHSFANTVMHIIGTSRFIVFYLAAGAMSSVAHLMYSRYIEPAMKKNQYSLFSPTFKDTSSHGASGAISASLMLFALTYPFTPIRLFFFVEVPAIVGIGGYVAYDLYLATAGQQGVVDSAAHVGGAAFGVLYWFFAYLSLSAKTNAFVMTDIEVSLQATATEAPGMNPSTKRSCIPTAVSRSASSQSQVQAAVPRPTWNSSTKPILSTKTRPASSTSTVNASTIPIPTTTAKKTGATQPTPTANAARSLSASSRLSFSGSTVPSTSPAIRRTPANYTNTDTNASSFSQPRKPTSQPSSAKTQIHPGPSQGPKKAAMVPPAAEKVTSAGGHSRLSSYRPSAHGTSNTPLSSSMHHHSNGQQMQHSMSSSSIQTIESITSIMAGVTTKGVGKHDLQDHYEHILASKNASEKSMRVTLRTLRHLILTQGIPNSNSAAGGSPQGLRHRVWKLLLGVYKTSADEYLGLVAKGPSSVFDKVKNDAFRTLMGDVSFGKVVDEGMIIRVLNAFAWRAKDYPTSRLVNLQFSYVQGMNVLAAPFLYVMPELDAFYTFATFIHHTCPLYVQPALEGVHCGIKLLDKCLMIADPQLHVFLKSKNLDPVMYAFPPVMTFSSCTPPLGEVLKLWDFLLSYGVHMNILCIVGQLVLMRNEILKSPSPMKILRTFPKLDAKRVIGMSIKVLEGIPDSLYDMLVRHVFDAMVCEGVLNEDE